MKEILRKIKIVKNENGITLVALVVTIVVLLILSGITIGLLFSDNGIIKRAQDAGNKLNEAEKSDLQGLDNLDDFIGSQMGEGSRAGFSEEDGVNAPKLDSKGEMVPVRWNNEDKSWYVCNSENTDKQWYEYGTTEGHKNWANIMLRDGLVVEGMTEEETKTAKIEDLSGKKVTSLGSMFVWIPRYAYKMESVAPTIETTTDETTGETTQTITDPGRGYHTNVAGKIEIAFLKGTTDQLADSSKKIVEYNETTTENYTKFPDGYVIHPAFNYGERISGIWVAKFEASHTRCTTVATTGQINTTSRTLQVKPNVTSWRTISYINMYKVCLNYKPTLNSHQMKNTEWGAVAYFSHSAYGLENNGILGEIGQNQCKTYITGSGPATDGTAYSYDKATYAEMYSYTSTQGKLASTTKNGTGIYDLRGGANERVAALISTSPKTDKTRDYYIKTSENTAIANFEANKNKYGDAIWETSLTTAQSTNNNAWNGNSSIFPLGSLTYFSHGGAATGSFVGLFSLGNSTGPIPYCSFRPVLVVL